MEGNGYQRFDARLLEVAMASVAGVFDPAVRADEPLHLASGEGLHAKEGTGAAIRPEGR